jgi:nitrogen fixation/metabolism regulation signal transduction histidine kinase
VQNSSSTALLSLTRSQHLDHATEPVDLATLAEDALDAQAGLGLGLAIVQSVADAHHAQLTLTARPTGGLDTVELPT